MTDAVAALHTALHSIWVEPRGVAVTVHSGTAVCVCVRACVCVCVCVRMRVCVLYVKLWTAKRHL